MNRFEGKTVLVTGGSSGIGLATAKAFAGKAPVSSSPAATRGTGARPRPHWARKADRHAQRCRRHLRRAKALADDDRGAAASSSTRCSSTRASRSSAAFAGRDEAIWDESFNTNVKGAYFQIQALLPLLNAARRS